MKKFILIVVPKVLHPTKFQVCSICSSRFTKKSHLRKHIKMEHAHMDDMTLSQLEIVEKSTPWACTHIGCVKTFTTEGKMKSHEKKHINLPHVCPEEDCLMRFAFRRELQKHQKVDHVPTCLVCQKTFKSWKTLHSHKSIHKDELMNEHMCPHDGCHKVYTRKGNLNVHIRQAHGEGGKSFKCEQCDESFGYKHTLERHIKKIHVTRDESVLPEAKKKKTITLEQILPKSLII